MNKIPQISHFAILVYKVGLPYRYISASEQTSCSSNCVAAICQWYDRVGTSCYGSVAPTTLHPGDRGVDESERLFVYCYDWLYHPVVSKDLLLVIRQIKLYEYRARSLYRLVILTLTGCISSWWLPNAKQPNQILVQWMQFYKLFRLPVHSVPLSRTIEKVEFIADKRIMEFLKHLWSHFNDRILRWTDRREYGYWFLHYFCTYE